MAIFVGVAVSVVNDVVDCCVCVSFVMVEKGGFI